ncbi:MAG: hypothetical protein IJ760_02650 [Bacteroidales bacterium]|nr:hypothetical protein [Bacteroidales bacterium]
MKKVLSFIGAAAIVAAMTVACNHKAAETADTTACCEKTEQCCEQKDAVESAATSESDNDASAMLAAAKEAGQAICNCTNGDAASIENCMNSVLAASYAQYEGNTEFSAAVKAEIENCVKAKATEAAKDAVSEGVKAGANALAKEIAKKK